jgi:hypothetical protein
MVALAFAVHAVAHAQPLASSEYAAIVSAYRDADPRALTRISPHPASALEPLVRSAVEEAWDVRDLRAAAMLHTESGVSRLRTGRIDEGVAQVNLAAHLIDATIDRSGRHVPYAARWYAAVSEIVRVHSPAWGTALDQRRGDRLASRTGLEALARGRKLEVLAKTGARRISDAPTVHVNPVAAFEEAVHLDPDLHEAWLHLGRLRMNEPDAAGGAMHALGRAAASPERRIRYLSAMFLGSIHEREGRFSDAEHAYRRAADTYPWAQSARLALAHLLSRTTREAEAREVIAQQIQQPPGEVSDPLWTYYAAPDELLDATLRELRIEVMR